ncbi:site-specific integrase [Pigmentiphaga sp. CHJ604]|uniref:tyrosine-type recombinase/integrase n=1 Tax=Pigmentiphaga sp. CHJ604 TaxID=3081984 RepID=UPI0030CE1DE1
MPIRQRGNTWWIDIRTPGGERIRRSTETSDRRKAQEYHDRLKAQMWAQAKLGEAPERVYEEAAVRFLKHYAGQADFDSKARYIAYWRTKFGGWPLVNITADAVADNLPTHKVGKGGAPAPLTPATVNRYVATLRTMLNMCEGWKWLARAPKLADLHEPKKRIRWITQDQATDLIAAVTQDWLRDVVAFALATGARMSEILGLQWSQVNAPERTAWLEADETKSARARSIPLSGDAMAVIRRRLGQHQTHVFTRGGNVINEVDRRMFQRACEVAGITNFKFHDLRHTWASWHVQRGTPLMVLKELGGWETIEMVQKYAHLGKSHLAAHADAVTFWSQQAEEGTLEIKTPPGRAALSA